VGRSSVCLGDTLRDRCNTRSKPRSGSAHDPNRSLTWVFMLQRQLDLASAGADGGTKIGDILADKTGGV